MKEYKEFQQNLLNSFQMQFKLLLENLQKYSLTTTNVELLNHFTQQLITIKNDLEELNELFINNTNTEVIQQKINQFHLTNETIQKLLPYLILETI